jgi:hypothetical protein
MGRADRKKGCADRIKGCADRIKGCADTIKGCADRIKGCADRIKGCADRIKGCADRIKGCADRIKGCADSKPRYFPYQLGNGTSADIRLIVLKVALGVSFSLTSTCFYRRTPPHAQARSRGDLSKKAASAAIWPLICQVRKAVECCRGA